MKAKDFFLPAIVVVLAASAEEQLFKITPESRITGIVRAEVRKAKTREFLEVNVRSKIDFLSKRYDLDGLQDQ